MINEPESKNIHTVGILLSMSFFSEAGSLNGAVYLSNDNAGLRHETSYRAKGQILAWQALQYGAMSSEDL